MGKRRSYGEGTLYYDDGRARWVGQVFIAGRRRKVTARTKTEAAAKLGRLIHGDQAERHADRRATVRWLLDEWQAKALPGRGLAPSTLEIHRWAAAMWADYIGSTKLVDLTAADVDSTLAAMVKDRSLSKSSIGKLRSTLRQALRWAERRRVVAYNPAAAAELPPTARATRPRRALSPAELRRLLVALKGHPWLGMYALMGRVGLRPGEAAAVCTDAVDLDGTPPTVAVVRAVQQQKARPVLVDSLKTAGARRTVALPPDVQKILFRAQRSSGLLFTTEGGGPVWPTTMRAELAMACREAGIEVVTPNELRHTAATILADSGLPPHRVADVLGHSSTRMVDAVYRHRPEIRLGPESVTL